MQPDARVGIDGSWSHRRNAAECIVDMYNCRSGKFVDFEAVSKNNPCYPGNYEDSSNGMEVDGCRKIIEGWDGNPHVKNIILDKDSKVGKAIQASRMKVEHSLDTNHAAKTLERK
jgi:hypothetical protein